MILGEYGACRAAEGVSATSLGYALSLPESLSVPGCVICSDVLW